MTEQDILKALSNVQEPDLGKDLVTLNMIKDIVINGNKVSFTIILTTPACPMKDMMRMASENAVKLLVNKEAAVTVNFTSNTSSNRKDAKTVLNGVRNIIAVVSGKGGVGREFAVVCCLYNGRQTSRIFPFTVNFSHSKGLRWSCAY